MLVRGDGRTAAMLPHDAKAAADCYSNVTARRYAPSPEARIAYTTPASLPRR